MLLYYLVGIPMISENWNESYVVPHLAYDMIKERIKSMQPWFCHFILRYNKFEKIQRITVKFSQT